MKRSILFVTSLSALLATTGLADPPASISNQGRIIQNGANFDGTGYFKFTLLDGGADEVIQATATATVSGGRVISIQVTDGGAGYPDPPLVAIVDTNGSGATATAVVTNGSVTAINVTDTGFGYTTTNTVVNIRQPDAVLVESLWSNDGTSSNGTEPASAVPVNINNGHYSLALGDTNLSGMTDALSPSTFSDNRTVRLRTWFADNAGGPFEQLSPDQVLLTSPFAFHSGTADNITPGSPLDDIFIGTGNPNDDDSIFFDFATNEFLRWDESDSQFEFSDDLTINGLLQAGSSSPNQVGFHRIGTGGTSHGASVNGLTDLLVTGDLEINGQLFADGGLSIPSGSIGTAALENQSVNSTKVLDNSLTAADLADNSVGSSELQPSSVTTSELADNSVTSSKVVDGSLTAADLGANSVTSDEVANDSLTAADLAPDSVTSSELGIGSVGASELGIDLLRAATNDTFTGGTLTVSGSSILSILNGGKIRFDNSSSRELFWDDAENRLELESGFATAGVLQGGTLVNTTPYHRFGSGTANQNFMDGPSDLYVSDSLEVEGNVYVDTNLYVGTDFATNRDSIYFDEIALPKSLAWDNADDRFEFSRSLQISGYVEADVDITAGDDLIATNNVEVGGLVAFTGVSPSESLTFDGIQSRFEMSDDLAISGALRVGTTSQAPVSYNRMGFGVETTRFPGSIVNGDDLFVEGNIEAAYFVFASIFETGSDRNSKEEFEEIDESEILDKVAALPLTTWNFKRDDQGNRHLGPMAQDFHAAFGLGSSDKSIATVDADGVALAAIQGLKKLVDQQAAALEEKDAQLRRLEERLIALEAARGRN